MVTFESPSLWGVMQRWASIDRAATGNCITIGRLVRLHFGLIYIRRECAQCVAVCERLGLAARSRPDRRRRKQTDRQTRAGAAQKEEVSFGRGQFAGEWGSKWRGNWRGKLEGKGAQKDTNDKFATSELVRRLEARGREKRKREKGESQRRVTSGPSLCCLVRDLFGAQLGQHKQVQRTHQTHRLASLSLRFHSRLSVRVDTGE